MTLPLLLALVLADSTVAPPAAPSENEAASAQTAHVEGFHALADVETTANAATLYAPSYSEVFTAARIQPRFGFRAGSIPLVFGARTGLAVELTRPDAVNGQRVHYGGVDVFLSAPEIWTHGQLLSFTSSLILAPPIATPARAGVQLRAHAAWGQFRAGAIIDGALVALPPSPCEVPLGPCLVRLSDPQPAGGAASRLSLFGRFEVRPVATVFVGAGAGIGMADMAPPSGGDEFAPPGGFPRPIAAVAASELYVTWSAHPRFGLTFALESRGGLYTPDGRTLRVPFVHPTGADVATLRMFFRTDERLEPRWTAP